MPIEESFIWQLVLKASSNIGDFAKQIDAIARGGEDAKDAIRSLGETARQFNQEARRQLGAENLFQEPIRGARQFRQEMGQNFEIMREFERKSRIRLDLDVSNIEQELSEVRRKIASFRTPGIRLTVERKKGLEELEEQAGQLRKRLEEIRPPDLNRTRQQMADITGFVQELEKGKGLRLPAVPESLRTLVDDLRRSKFPEATVREGGGLVRSNTNKAFLQELENAAIDRGKELSQQFNNELAKGEQLTTRIQVAREKLNRSLARSVADLRVQGAKQALSVISPDTDRTGEINALRQGLREQARLRRDAERRQLFSDVQGLPPAEQKTFFQENRAKLQNQFRAENAQDLVEIENKITREIERQNSAISQQIAARSRVGETIARQARDLEERAARRALVSGPQIDTAAEDRLRQILVEKAAVAREQVRARLSQEITAGGGTAESQALDREQLQQILIHQELEDQRAIEAEIVNLIARQTAELARQAGVRDQLLRSIRQEAGTAQAEAFKRRIATSPTVDDADVEGLRATLQTRAIQEINQRLQDRLKEIDTTDLPEPRREPERVLARNTAALQQEEAIARVNGEINELVARRAAEINKGTLAVERERESYDRLFSEIDQGFLQAQVESNRFLAAIRKPSAEARVFSTASRQQLAGVAELDALTSRDLFRKSTITFPRAGPNTSQTVRDLVGFSQTAINTVEKELDPIEIKIQAKLDEFSVRRELEKAKVLANAEKQVKAISAIPTDQITDVDRSNRLNQVRQTAIALSDAVDQRFSRSAAAVAVLDNEFDRLSARAGKLRQFSFDLGIFARNVAGLGVALSFPIAQGARDLQQLSVRLGAFNAIAKQTQDEMANTRTAVLRTFTSVPVESLDDLGTALFNIASSAFTGKDSLRILEVSAKLAAIGMTDTNTSAKILAQTMKAFDVEAAGAASTAGKLVSILNSSIGEFNEVGAALGRASAGTRIANQDLERLGAAFSILTTAGGLSPRRAGEAINRLFLDLSTGRQKIRENLGIDTVTGGLTKPIEQFIGELEDLQKQGKLTIDSLNRGFEEDTARRAVVVLINNSQQFKAVLNDIQNSSVTFEDAFERATTNAGSQMQLLANNFRVFGIVAADALTPIFNILTSASKVISEFALHNQALVGRFTVAAASIATITAAGLGLASLMTRLRTLTTDVALRIVGLTRDGLREADSETLRNRAMTQGNALMAQQSASAALLTKELNALTAANLGLAQAQGVAAAGGVAGGAVGGAAKTATAASTLPPLLPKAPEKPKISFGSFGSSGATSKRLLDLTVSTVGITSILNPLQKAIPALLAGFSRLASGMFVVGAIISGAGIFLEAARQSAENDRKEKEKAIDVLQKLSGVTKLSTEQQLAYSDALSKLVGIGPDVAAVLNQTATSVEGAIAIRKELERIGEGGDALRFFKQLGDFWEGLTVQSTGGQVANLKTETGSFSQFENKFGFSDPRRFFLPNPLVRKDQRGLGPEDTPAIANLINRIGEELGTALRSGNAEARDLALARLEEVRKATERLERPGTGVGAFGNERVVEELKEQRREFVSSIGSLVNTGGKQIDEFTQAIELASNQSKNPILQRTPSSSGLSAVRDLLEFNLGRPLKLNVDLALNPDQTYQTLLDLQKKGLVVELTREQAQNTLGAIGIDPQRRVISFNQQKQPVRQDNLAGQFQNQGARFFLGSQLATYLENGQDLVAGPIREAAETLRREEIRFRNRARQDLRIEEAQAGITNEFGRQIGDILRRFEETRIPLEERAVAATNPRRLATLDKALDLEKQGKTDLAKKAREEAELSFIEDKALAEAQYANAREEAERRLQELVLQRLDSESKITQEIRQQLDLSRARFIKAFDPSIEGKKLAIRLELSATLRKLQEDAARQNIDLQRDIQKGLFDQAGLLRLIEENRSKINQPLVRPETLRYREEPLGIPAPRGELISRIDPEEEKKRKEEQIRLRNQKGQPPAPAPRPPAPAPPRPPRPPAPIPPEFPSTQGINRPGPLPDRGGRGEDNYRSRAAFRDRERQRQREKAQEQQAARSRDRDRIRVLEQPVGELRPSTQFPVLPDPANLGADLKPVMDQQSAIQNRAIQLVGTEFFKDGCALAVSAILADVFEELATFSEPSVANLVKRLNKLGAKSFTDPKLARPGDIAVFRPPGISHTGVLASRGGTTGLIHNSTAAGYKLAFQSGLSLRGERPDQFLRLPNLTVRTGNELLANTLVDQLGNVGARRTIPPAVQAQQTARLILDQQTARQEALLAEFNAEDEGRKEQFRLRQEFDQASLEADRAIFRSEEEQQEFRKQEIIREGRIRREALIEERLSIERELRARARIAPVEPPPGLTPVDEAAFRARQTTSDILTQFGGPAGRVFPSEKLKELSDRLNIQAQKERQLVNQTATDNTNLFLQRLSNDSRLADLRAGMLSEELEVEAEIARRRGEGADAEIRLNEQLLKVELNRLGTALNEAIARDAVLESQQSALEVSKILAQIQNKQLDTEKKNAELRIEKLRQELELSGAIAESRLLAESNAQIRLGLARPVGVEEDLSLRALQTQEEKNRLDRDNLLLQAQIENKTSGISREARAVLVEQQRQNRLRREELDLRLEEERINRRAQQRSQALNLGERLGVFSREQAARFRLENDELFREAGESAFAPIERQLEGIDQLTQSWQEHFRYLSSLYDVDREDRLRSLKAQAELLTPLSEQGLAARREFLQVEMEDLNALRAGVREVVRGGLEDAVRDPGSLQIGDFLRRLGSEIRAGFARPAIDRIVARVGRVTDRAAAPAFGFQIPDLAARQREEAVALNEIRALQADAAKKFRETVKTEEAAQFAEISARQTTAAQELQNAGTRLIAAADALISSGAQLRLPEAQEFRATGLEKLDLTLPDIQKELTGERFAETFGRFARKQPQDPNLEQGVFSNRFIWPELGPVELTLKSQIPAPNQNSVPDLKEPVVSPVTFNPVVKPATPNVAFNPVIKPAEVRLPGALVRSAPEPKALPVPNRFAPPDRNPVELTLKDPFAKPPQERLDVTELSQVAAQHRAAAGELLKAGSSLLVAAEALSRLGPQVTLPPSQQIPERLGRESLDRFDPTLPDISQAFTGDALAKAFGVRSFGEERAIPSPTDQLVLSDVFARPLKAEMDKDREIKRREPPLSFSVGKSVETGVDRALTAITPPPSAPDRGLDFRLPDISAALTGGAFAASFAAGQSRTPKVGITPEALQLSQAFAGPMDKTLSKFFGNPTDRFTPGFAGPIVTGDNRRKNHMVLGGRNTVSQIAAGLAAFQGGQEGGVAGGVLSGALTGAAFGPVGALIGGGLGLLGGLFGKKKKKPPEPRDFPELPPFEDIAFAAKRFLQGAGEGGREGLPINLQVNRTNQNDQSVTVNIQNLNVTAANGQRVEDVSAEAIRKQVNARMR